jgi:hypothetical protein
MPPEPAIRYRRTPDELASPELSWARSDRAFFAAGACHILAYCAIERWPGRALEMVYLRPAKGYAGHHVWASNGRIAFDFNGWCLETELLRANEEACRAEAPSWRYSLELIPLADLDEAFQTRRLRAPSQFPGNVLARAEAYIDEAELKNELKMSAQFK